MRLGLRMGLNSRQGGGGVLDPDARLYIAAVETALGTPIATALPSATSNPKRIISDFIKAEKAASRWALHKRIYLPIYANAAASAIDMVSRLSGEFLFGANHSTVGYVEYNGTSNYFSTIQTLPSMGLSFDSSNIGIGSLLDSIQTSGNRTGGVERFVLFDSGTNLSIAMPSTGVDAISASTPSSGHLIGTITASNSRAVYRIHSGGTQSAANTATSTTALANLSAFFAANNNNGTVNFQGAATIRHAFYHLGLGLSPSNVSGFSSNLKTLWESLTGLTLP